MAKQYAVLHVQRGSARPAGLDKHIGREHVPHNADPQAQGKNRSLSRDSSGVLRGSPLTPSSARISERVEARIKEGYKGSRKIRKDAVRRLDVVLTGTHERMSSMDNKELSSWLSANYMFLEEQYGSENIVSFVLHLDELTPHVHATVVPLTHDGRLSADEVMGNRKKLQELQDKYSEKMAVFGLERGERGSRASHVATAEYYRQISSLEGDEGLRELEGISLPTPPIIGRESWAREQEAQIRAKIAPFTEYYKANEVKSRARGENAKNKAIFSPRRVHEVTREATGRQAQATPPIQPLGQKGRKNKI